MSKKMTNEEFDNKLLSNGVLDIVRVDDYIDAHTKIRFKHISCGREWETRPANVSNGSGCKHCGIESRTKKVIKSSLKTGQYYLKKFREVHRMKYIYDLSNYKSCKDYTFITCPEHGGFKQRISAHANGQGCPFCNIGKGQFDTTKTATLYYLHFKGVDIYKIGITNRTLNKRFSKTELDSCSVVWVHECKGDEALRLEKKVLQQFSIYKYDGEQIIVSGNTELFTKNILPTKEELWKLD